MKKSTLTQPAGFVSGLFAIALAQFTVNAQINYQRGGDMVGTGTNAWSYLIMEGESYVTKVAAPEVGFTKAYADGALTNFYGNPVLGTNSTASKGGALAGQTIFGQYADKITYQVQFQTTGTYYLYMRFTMFENGSAIANYLNEDSFFLPPDFGKDPQTDWPTGSDRGGYCEGGLSGAGFLWILEPCTGGSRTNHSGNDGLDQAYYWEGNFHWNQLFTSQFLTPAQGVAGDVFRYVVTPDRVGVPLDFTIGYREAGVTVDLFLFSTHTNLMEHYSQTALDNLLVNKVSVQDAGDVVGTGTNAWSYLIMEGEDYEFETNAAPGIGFTTVHAGDGITNFYGNPVLGANTTASQGGALAGQTIFGQYADKITYQVQFQTTGTYYLYMRFTMFENGSAIANYLNEDSFFLPPDFGKDPQTDWPTGSDRGGYCEGGLSGAGFLWILEPGTGGSRTNHSGNDGLDQAYYWEGNFHWNQLFTSQFLTPAQGVAGDVFRYVVTPDNVGKKLNFTIGYREAGVTVDQFLFSTHTNLMENYTQTELDQLFAGPRLKITLAGTTALVSWPASATAAGFVLETTSSLSPPSWTLVPCPAPDVSGGRNSVTVDVSSGSGYYRLKQL